jgi:hypothetical protein
MDIPRCVDSILLLDLTNRNLLIRHLSNPLHHSKHFSLCIKDNQVIVSWSNCCLNCPSSETVEGKPQCASIYHNH